MKKNTITLKTAKRWTKRWRKMEDVYNAHQECRAFNIPLEDLKDVIAEGAVTVRAYLGVHKQKIESETVFEEKLIIVGVDANGKDMISSKDGEVLDPDSGNIYDLTRPCPSFCDPDSPLNGTN
ncbi:hypothetical protein H9I45_12335 [Polaribacter haliotis]|uniref:Uncharacterized protein n=1 Tax=Polaribacter haliotis TaxID=1888915 RepID=A0A7L8ADQ0_9FLAO|nr:hypothetical protein [Polaribacter haliotis]QOD60122.1 hypothetical protein H9I45_12335 [Polaribacter haliotis]